MVFHFTENQDKKQHLELPIKPKVDHVGFIIPPINCFLNSGSQQQLILKMPTLLVVLFLQKIKVMQTAPNLSGYLMIMFLSKIPLVFLQALVKYKDSGLRKRD